MSIDLSSLGPADLEALHGVLAKLKGGADNSDVKKRRKRPKKQAIQYLEEDEIERLFRAVKDPRDKAILRVAYHRGLRASEIGRLDLSDYRVKDDRLQVNRLKGSASGEYHLCGNEVRALKAWLKVRGTSPGPLFPSRTGKGISRQMLDVLIRRYGAAAGLPREKCHMHALKHSCGTHLLNRGESIEDVQDHLGHRNIQNTLVYAKLTNRRREQRDKRLRDW